MSDDLRFSHTIVIDAPRQRVWDALTSPAERNKYVCTENQTDLRPGGAFIELFQYGPARAGIFLVVSAPNRLVQENFVFDRGVSHRYYNAFTLANSFGGTELTIDVEGFDHNDSEDWLRESMKVGWKTELQVLKAYVETGADIRPQVWKGVLMGLRFVTAQASPGVRVIDVIAGTPAAAAGLRVGDVINGVDGTKVGDFAEFRELVGRFRPGDSASFQVWRDGESADHAITFGNAIA
ncbi:PDZ domain-containing protein [Asanoa ferruginea]|uniref:PDZ domain-containing protein n=1 Tax=Asanoa ferruginea TaxID=53367 RepID=A0A3D9ZNW1_9ACTN|nr:SRPBCC domain-containing protein [Asanoa ferruginea]REF98877.1 PDZ domain-containing protein [Asanoa ferruginea]GIF46441.1 hypothetical protein Afe04nite_09800 [Asanoa ferruginea]